MGPDEARNDPQVLAHLLAAKGLVKQVIDHLDPSDNVVDCVVEGILRGIYAAMKRALDYIDTYVEEAQGAED